MMDMDKAKDYGRMDDEESKEEVPIRASERGLSKAQMLLRDVFKVEEEPASPRIIRMEEAKAVSPPSGVPAITNYERGNLRNNFKKSNLMPEIEQEGQKNDTLDFTITNNDWERDTESIIVNDDLLLDNFDKVDTRQLFDLKPIEPKTCVYENDDFEFLELI